MADTKPGYISESEVGSLTSVCIDRNLVSERQMQVLHHQSNATLFATLVLACCVAQLGCQDRETNKPPAQKSMLDDQLKTKYRAELKRDPDKEFGPEFVRTTDLERALVDEHEFDAIKLIFEDRNGANFFQIGELPPECPWAHLNGKSVDAAVDIVFAPIADDIPKLIAALKDRCKYIYAERSDEAWKLHYFLDTVLYDGRRYYHIYSGGEPHPAPDTNASLAIFNWSVPSELKRLYAIHDGFGPILGSKEISVMAQMMDPICKEQNNFPERYRFSDLLEFHPDGGGNCQCFHRQGDRLATVDWDHETWEISGEQGLFEYLDERLSQLDEE